MPNRGIGQWSHSHVIYAEDGRSGVYRREGSDWSTANACLRRSQLTLCETSASSVWHFSVYAFRHMHPTPYAFYSSTHFVSFLYFPLLAPWNETEIILVYQSQDENVSTLEPFNAQMKIHWNLWRSFRFVVSMYRERGIDVAGQQFLSSTSAFAPPVYVIRTGNTNGEFKDENGCPGEATFLLRYVDTPNLRLRQLHMAFH